jgi:hypothetical protein
MADSAAGTPATPGTLPVATCWLRLLRAAADSMPEALDMEPCCEASPRADATDEGRDAAAACSPPACSLVDFGVPAGKPAACSLELFAVRCCAGTAGP